MTSLRARLLLAIGSATLLVWLSAAGLAYHEAHHEATQLLDAQLAQSARLLLARMTHEEHRRERRHTEDDGEASQDDNHEEIAEHSGQDQPDPYVQDQAYAVWRLPEQALLRSDNALSMPRQAQVGYREFQAAGLAWRVISLRDRQERLQVQVAQPTLGRDHAALNVALRVAVPMAIALPLLLGFIYLAVRRGLAPLDTLAHEVGRRKADDLQPLAASDVPDEARSLITALDDLLARMARTLDNERRFTADAAHELRTPLAALKVQAQVAGLATDKDTRMHAIEQLLSGADRAAHLVEQLLRLARLDPLQGPAEIKPFKLDTLFSAALQHQVQAALDKHQHLDASSEFPDQELFGDADMLAVALRNLIENARHYTPDNGHIELGAKQSGHELQIWVRDDGPGASPDELKRLSERFYRGRDVSCAGSGLGLAIAQRIAELHGGHLHLANRPTGGFEASLCLPIKQSFKS